jgi:hypothetical protein
VEVVEDGTAEVPKIPTFILMLCNVLVVAQVGLILLQVLATDHQDMQVCN